MSMSYWLPIALLWLPGIATAGILGPKPRTLHPAITISLGYMACALFAAFSVPVAHWLLGTIIVPNLVGTYLSVVGLFWLLCWSVLRLSPDRVVKSPEFPDFTSVGRWELLALPLFGLFIARFWQLAVESTGRPLMGWDAWHSWAAKAKVWTANEALTAFNQLWMTGSSVPAGHFTRMKHPDTLPWLLTWFSISGGGWSEPMLGLLYLSLYVAIALLFYGVTRQLGGNRLIAMAGVVFVTSLPYVNTHVALPGYADLWLAAFFVAGAAMIQLVPIFQKRDRQVLWVAVLLCIVGTAAIKMTGIAWSAILVAALLTAVVPRTYWLMTALPVFLIAWLAIWRPEWIWLPFGEGYWRLEFENVTGPLVNVLFALKDWHLLWWLFACGLCLLPFAKKSEVSLRPICALVCLSATFLFAGYYLSRRADWVLDYTAVNRALLPLALVMALWLVFFFVTRWQAGNSESR